MIACSTARQAVWLTPRRRCRGRRASQPSRRGRARRRRQSRAAGRPRRRRSSAPDSTRPRLEWDDAAAVRVGPPTAGARRAATQEDQGPPTPPAEPKPFAHRRPLSIPSFNCRKNGECGNRMASAVYNGRGTTRPVARSRRGIPRRMPAPSAFPPCRPAKNTARRRRRARCKPAIQLGISRAWAIAHSQNESTWVADRR